MDTSPCIPSFQRKGTPTRLNMMLAICKTRSYIQKGHVGISRKKQKYKQTTTQPHIIMSLVVLLSATKGLLPGGLSPGPCPPP